jgi:hypothetical protein
MRAPQHIWQGVCRVPRTQGAILPISSLPLITKCLEGRCFQKSVYRSLHKGGARPFG